MRRDYLRKISSGLEEEHQRLAVLDSIFIGGGTPTQLNEDELISLLTSVNAATQKSRDMEFSVECNPATVNAEKFRIMKQHGVNRLSFGGQSTSRKTRRALGRRSSNHQLYSAIDLARSSGFENINIDMMYGIPGQSLEDWEQDLDNIIKLDLPHFSAYSLILEEDTPLAKIYDGVDDDMAVEIV